MKSERYANTKYVRYLTNGLNEIEKETLETVNCVENHSPAEIVDWICFFNSLKKKCGELLPEYYVKNVVLVSDYSGKVKSVKYEYYAPGESISAPGIRICSDSYIDKTINPALSAAV